MFEGAKKLKESASTILAFIRWRGERCEPPDDFNTSPTQYQLCNNDNAIEIVFCFRACGPVRYRGLSMAGGPGWFF